MTATTLSWVIIDTKKQTVLHGYNQRTLTFSTSSVAQEVASQLFEKENHYMVVHIPDIHQSRLGDSKINN